jgi:hypothetical protein
VTVTTRRNGVARRFFRWYGANPLHLLACLAAFSLAGYAALRFVPANPVGVAVWIVGGALGHDLLLLPLYGLADRSVAAIVRRRASAATWNAWLNHVRVPAALSGLAFAVFLPLILGLPVNLAGVTGRPPPDYFARWLVLTGLLFAGSAVILGWRLRRLRARAAGRVTSSSVRGAA